MSSTSTITLTMENGMDVLMTFEPEPSLEFAVDNAAAFEAAVGTVTGALSDYERLNNLPSIEGVTLIGNHTQEELGISSIGNASILALF